MTLVRRSASLLGNTMFPKPSFGSACGKRAPAFDVAGRCILC